MIYYILQRSDLCLDNFHHAAVHAHTAGEGEFAFFGGGEAVNPGIDGFEGVVDVKSAESKGGRATIDSPLGLKGELDRSAGADGEFVGSVAGVGNCESDLLDAVYENYVWIPGGTLCS